MIKALTIIFGIFFFIWLGFRYLRSKLRSFLFQGFDPSKFNNPNSSDFQNPFQNAQKNDQEVVFKDGETVIYKGSAGKKND